MTAKAPAPVVKRQRAILEPPPLKKLAMWSGIVTTWVAFITAIAHATAAGKGPYYISMILAVLCVAPFTFVGFRLISIRSRPMIAAALLVMVGATTIATMISVFDGSVAAGVAGATLGSILVIASAIGTLAALHQLGERARGSLRFLVVELVAIPLIIWTENIAPALLAGLVYWVLWKTAPEPPRPFRVYRGDEAK